MGIVLVLVFLAICILAPFVGSDSRIDDPRRGWWPGSYRRQ
jgi:hypothetical protein